jgi:hypothetical protein
MQVLEIRQFFAHRGIVLHAARIVRPIAPIINPKARNKSAKPEEYVSRQSFCTDKKYPGSEGLQAPGQFFFGDNDLSAVVLWYITTAWNY